MTERITKESLKKYVATHTNLVRIKQSEEYPSLSVLKYAKKVFYDNLWDNFLMQFRGTVFDQDFNIKALPFEKTFNRLEQPTSEFDRDEEVVAVRKVNGFMCSVTYVPELGHPIVCTTGSLDSAFCDYARHMIPETAMFWITKESFGKEVMQTYIFEICHPEDPHVVPEELGAYYLGSRPCTYDELDNPQSLQFEAYQLVYDREAAEMEVKRPEWKVTRWANIIEEVKTVKHEGFMCWKNDIHISKSVKLKSPYYSITKYLGRKPESVWNSLTSSINNVFRENSQIVLDIKGIIDTKFPEFTKLTDEQDKFRIIRRLLDEQKIYNK